jgi:hypothetical protein
MLLLIALCAPAWPQRFSAGALAGGGRIWVEDYRAQSTGFVGAEASVVWSEVGHGVFFDYARWPLNDKYLRAEDVIAFGWLWQPPGKRVRPFFEAGITAITSRYGPGDHTGFGAAARGGVVVPLGKRFYVRPFVRADLTIYRVPVGFGTAVGYRF